MFIYTPLYIPPYIPLMPNLPPPTTTHLLTHNEQVLYRLEAKFQLLGEINNFVNKKMISQRNP